jgi:hypothetical protein
MCRADRSRRLAALALVVAGVVAVASCSSSDNSNSDANTEATEPTRASFTGHAPTEIASPPARGSINEPQPAAPLPKGYVEEEFLVGGTATRFAADDTPESGEWVATPAGEKQYRTRVIVRRPASAEDFSGTVLVEWLNVSALESSPDWAFLADEIGRAGHAYVGVSAQAQGVEGGDTLLDVEVDPEQAEALGADADKSGLKNINPARYGTLVHPGDAYAYDIFSQVARAVDEKPQQLLGVLMPKQVIAVGESQSAAFLTTLANAVHPLDPAFDGFLIHSRGANGAPLDGEITGGREGSDDSSGIASRAVRVRTDLDVPVFMFETETDLTLLQYAKARQPDTDTVRTWEVAGTSHADAHFVRSIVGGPRDGGVGSLLGCKEPINTGPQHEVLQAALDHLVTWVANGTPPPTGPRITLEDEDEDPIVVARADDGIALGGVRNPLVDVPVATVTGDPPGGATNEELRNGGSICILFGGTTMFDQAALVDRYGSADEYVQQFRASADTAVAAGFLLQPDADKLVAEAETNRALFG